MSRWIPLALVVALASPVRADDKDDLLAAVRKATELKNYSFKGRSTFEPPPITGAPVQESSLEGKVDLAVGTHIVTDTQEIVRVGDKTVVRPRSGWRLVEEGPGGGGAGPGRPGGMLGMMGALRPPRAPHEDLKDLGSKIEKTAKSEKKEAVGGADCDVYAFELTADGARSIFPGGGLAGRFGQNQANVKFAGRGKAWVSDGTLVKLDLAASLSSSVNGNDFELTSFRSVTLSDVGKTQVEIPEEARKALKGKSD